MKTINLLASNNKHTRQIDRKKIFLIGGSIIAMSIYFFLNEKINHLQQKTHELRNYVLQQKITNEHLQASINKKTDESSLPESKTQGGVPKVFDQLSMTGFIQYGKDKWCLLENEQHQSFLLHEGESITEVTAKTISPDHVILASQDHEISLGISTREKKKIDF